MCNGCIICVMNIIICEYVVAYFRFYNLNSDVWEYFNFNIKYNFQISDFTLD